MKSQGDHRDDVDQDDPPLLKALRDLVVQVAHRVAAFDVRNRVAKLHGVPEVAHVDAQEDENDGAQQRRVGGGSPGRMCRSRLDGVDSIAALAAAGGAVAVPECESLDGVKRKARVQTVAKSADERIRGHEVSVVVEGNSFISPKQLQVAGEVDGQERDEEQTGEAHDDLLADRGGDEAYEPIHRRAGSAFAYVAKVAFVTVVKETSFCEGAKAARLFGMGRL